MEDLMKEDFKVQI